MTRSIAIGEIINHIWGGSGPRYKSVQLSKNVFLLHQSFLHDGNAPYFYIRNDRYMGKSILLRVDGGRRTRKPRLKEMIEMVEFGIAISLSGSETVGSHIIR